MKNLIILALVLAFNSCDKKNHVNISASSGGNSAESALSSSSTSEVDHIDTSNLEDYEKLELISRLQAEFTEKNKFAVTVVKTVNYDEYISSLECLNASNLDSIKDSKVSRIRLAEKHGLEADEEYEGEFILQFWKGACKDSIEAWSKKTLVESKRILNKDSAFKILPEAKQAIGNFKLGKEVITTGAIRHTYEASDIEQEHAIAWAEVYSNGHKYWVLDEDLDKVSY